MRTLRRFFKRLISRATIRQDEERLQAEIEEHLALQTDENLRAGLSPVEARRQAVLKFGAVEAMKEGYRDGRGFPLAASLVQDTRYALRRLRKAPAFTLTTILTLALGIGATTSIFTLVYAVLMRSLAVTSPHELLRLGEQASCCYFTGYSQNREFSLISYDLYKHFRENTKGLAELAAFQASEPQFGVRRAGGSEPAHSFPGEFVSGNYFRMFGLRAYAGRTLTADDDQPGALPVAVMSYRLWRQRYRSDPSVIGAVLNVDEKPFTVVGVSPPGFFGDTLRGNPPDLFLPLHTQPLLDAADLDLNRPDAYWLHLIGRMRPGATPASIEADMRVELKQWLRSHWGEMNANERAAFPKQTLYLRPGGAGITSMREQYERWLRILMIVTGFVLLIVCANVANLMLVRGLERRRQTSLSMALGAHPLRLVRQALTESILLSLFGGAAGLIFAFISTSLILHFVFPPGAGLGSVPIEASPSGPVLLFAFGVSLLTGIAFGIAPAWIATRFDPIEALRGASRSIGIGKRAPTGSPLRKSLVVIQTAIALVLLSASGLLTSALQRLENQDFGFSQDRRVVASIDPMVAGYRVDQLTPLYRRLHDALSAIPGVSAVALCGYAPLSDTGWGADIWVNGRPSPGPNDDNFAVLNRVTPGYFNAIGNLILLGRGISEQDTAASRHVAVINEAFARKLFKNENPIGKYFGRHGIESERQYEVVGIARDARSLTSNLGSPILPQLFLPEAQHDFLPKTRGELSPATHFLRDIVIVTRPGTNLPLARVRQAVASVDPNLPIVSMQALKERVALVFSPRRLMARLTSFFGVLSLVLASIGLYGVTAYNAGRRTTEIGVRMALGADRWQVVMLVLRGAFGLIAVGLLLGLPLALATGKFLGSQLYGMDPYNPVVISLAVAALTLSALVASLIPALRASLISPLEALRAE